MRLFSVSLAVLFYMTASSVWAKPGTIRYVDVHQLKPDTVVVDTRAQALCLHRSLAGAHCLPATDLLGPSGELPNFADIFWALGTAGLDGSETVLVVGDRSGARDFVAGVLYLCGQAKVEILKPGIGRVLRAGAFPSGQGAPRAILRQRIYRASMRDAAILLPGELSQLRKQNQQVRLLDATQLNRDTAIAMYSYPKGQHAFSHYGREVVYASSVRTAIEWFTRLVARQGNATKRIQVIPVAVSGLNADAKRGGVHKLAAVTGSSRGVVTNRGEKKWS